MILAFILVYTILSYACYVMGHGKGYREGYLEARKTWEKK